MTYKHGLRCYFGQGDLQIRQSDLHDGPALTIHDDKAREIIGLVFDDDKSIDKVLDVLNKIKARLVADAEQ